MDELGAPDDQPAGFATPDAQPLGPYSTTLTTSAYTDPPAPADYLPAKDPGPALETVAPAPPVTRDPHLPFEGGQEDQMAPAAPRDPREPLVNLTPLGAPDFAPPTGAPVTTAKWAPPTGAPAAGMRPPEQSVGAIARQGAVSSDPYAQRWAALQNGQMPPGYPVPSSAYSTPGRTAGSRGLVAQYWASDGLGKLLIVLKAVPWPVILILLVGALLQQGTWAIWAICIAFLVCSSNAKIAKVVLNRVFMVASAVYFVFWLVMMLGQSASWGYTIYNAHFAIGQWLCVILALASPIIVWRAFEKH